MKYIFTILGISLTYLAIAQGEYLKPLSTNPSLMEERGSEVSAKAGTTFDSTFIYIQDTLSLPIFDDFSTDKFQNYEVDFGGPGVSTVKEYRLLDLGGTPLPNTSLYTQQQTFIRYFDIGNGDYYDTLLPTTDIQLGDQSSYPTAYSTVSVYPPYYIYDTLDFIDDIPDTIWIPDAEIYQDSATQFFDTIVDAGLYWVEREAYHNFTFADNPWTLGVVTFDGLDEFGYPYAIGTTTTNFADHLTSKPINMTPYTPGDSIYLSFIYQAEGLGDIPESGDSLILEFYDVGTANWNQVWSAGGESSTDFKVGHIRITQAEYFSNAFQFRFKNWGAVYGNLDHFHLDYVMLRPLSGYQDTLFKDFSFVYPVTTLLDQYTSVPWDHYKNSGINRMNPMTEITVRNGSNIAENNSVDGVCEVYYGGALEGSFTLPGSDLSNGNLNYDPRTTYLSFHDFTSGYEYTTGHPGPIEEFDVLSVASAQFPNFTGNDSTWSKQIFSNYYAYDDGSAERVYGTNEALSQISVKFDPYEADSLIGVQIHFIPHIQDMSNELFLVSVWSDLNGQPDTLIYQDDPFFPRTPKYKNKRNRFATYYFLDTAKVHVNGTFHIGFKQLSNGIYGVGFDRNINNSDKNHFYSPSTESWATSSYEGTLMIRPIYSTSYDAYLGVPETQSISNNVLLYPNPVFDILNINSETEIEQVIIMDYTGKVVLTSDNGRIDVSNLTPGLYFAQINGQGTLSKFIKK